ncbi:MAG: hypothetical protein ACAI35_18585 [Candidatus Methylacidiphilales bacterium]
MTPCIEYVGDKYGLDSLVGLLYAFDDVVFEVPNAQIGSQPGLDESAGGERSFHPKPYFGKYGYDAIRAIDLDIISESKAWLEKHSR